MSQNHRYTECKDQRIGLEFYSANLVSNVLEEAGINILGKQKYLDFGCSSGSLYRVSKLVFTKCVLARNRSC